MKDFKAIMLVSKAQGDTKYVDVTEFNGKMAIMTEEGPVLITKGHAMNFFDLYSKEHLEQACRVSRNEAREGLMRQIMDIGGNKS